MAFGPFFQVTSLAVGFSATRTRSGRPGCWGSHGCRLVSEGKEFAFQCACPRDFPRSRCQNGSLEHGIALQKRSQRCTVGVSRWFSCRRIETRQVEFALPSPRSWENLCSDWVGISKRGEVALVLHASRPWCPGLVRPLKLHQCRDWKVTYGLLAQAIGFRGVQADLLPHFSKSTWKKDICRIQWTKCIHQGCPLHFQWDEVMNLADELAEDSQNIQNGTWQATSSHRQVFHNSQIWVCLKMGHTPNYSHLVGIMIINHWVDWGTLFSDKPKYLLKPLAPHP